MSSVGERTCTPEDLFILSGDRRYELVAGKLVERSTNMWSSDVGSRLSFLLSQHARQHGLGWVMGADTAYQCFPDDAGKVRFLAAGTRLVWIVHPDSRRVEIHPWRTG